MTETDPSRSWPDDLQLVRAARRGQRRAVRALADRLACVWAMVRARDRRYGTTLDAHLLEEIAQESLLALWSKLDRYDGTSPLEAWAYGFVVLQHLKAMERAYRDSAQKPLEEDPARPPSLESAEDEDAFFRHVHDSVQALGSPTSEIIHRKHFGFMTFAEIAAELEMPESTVKTRYYRGLLKLRGTLEAVWRERSG